MNSLYDLIVESLVNGELPGDFSLPEEDGEEGLPSFADGARDGICMYHMGGSREIADADKELMIRALRAAAGRNTKGDVRGAADFEKAEKLFRELGKQRRALMLTDELQHYVRDHRDEFKSGDLYEAALWLLLQSSDRECVKFGLLLLELLDTDHNAEVKKHIRTIGISDEFTLFAVYVMKTWREGNDDVFRLAQKVHGWGRIHAVAHLRASSSSIKRWLLTEAVENDLPDAYSALMCWNKSDAWFVLRNHPDEAQFTGIRKILRGLLDEDAAAGISSMENRDQILSQFLDEAEKRSEKLTLDDYQVIYDISVYCKENEEKPGKSYLRSRKILLTYRCACVTIDAVKEGRAMEMARGTGFDVKRYIPDLLRASLKDHMYLCQYMMEDDACRKETLTICREQLPLEQMKTAPGMSLGLGEAYWKEEALVVLMQGLRHHPGEGKDFVECALQAEPVRCRNSGLYALECWVTKEERPLSEILPEFHDLLTRLRDAEPAEFNRKRIDALLSGAISFEEVDDIKKDIEYSKETLDILADAISDIGSWMWWNTGDDMFQMEFCDVQLYDDTKAEKEPHSSHVAVCFTGDYFAVFLDRTDDENWYVKLHNDDAGPFELDYEAFAFDDVKAAKDVMRSYRRRHAIRPRFDERLFSIKKHILSGKCGDVGFVVGGDRVEVVSRRGKYTEEMIVEGNKRWWGYWEDYWRLRGTSDAYEKDFACEVTIPVNRDNPQGER